MHKIIRTVGLGLTLLASTTQAALTETEEAILAAVEARQEQAVAFLRQVVDINSGTYNPAGVRQVGEIYRDAFADIGLSAQLLDLPASMERGPHMQADLAGERGKRVLLIGHLDTVFEPDSPFQAMRIEDGRAFGPGVEDMKGGNTVILFALRALADAGVLSGSQVKVFLTGDEEAPGSPLAQTRAPLLAAGRWADIALGYEAGVGSLNISTIARRGFSSWELSVSARRAHSSGIFQPDVGAGAVFELSRILSEFYDALHSEEYLTFNPGLVVAGSEIAMDASGVSASAGGKTNIIADQALARGDLRFLTEAQKEKARERMREIAAQSLPHTRAELTFADGYPAMEPTAGNRALMKQLGEVLAELDFGEVEALDPSKRGAADISFVAGDVEAALAGLGPVGGGGHTVDEYIDLQTLTDATRISALLIYRLTR